MREKTKDWIRRSDSQLALTHPWLGLNPAGTDRLRSETPQKRSTVSARTALPELTASAGTGVL